MKKNVINSIIVFASTVVLLVAAKFVSDYMSIGYGKIINVISLVIAAIGAWLVVYQLFLSKRLQEADFILNLNQLFTSNEHYAEMYKKLEKMNETKEKLEIERIEISNHLTFFETIYLLLKKNTLTIEILDDLFAYRFFLAVHNEVIQEIKLVASPYNFRNIYRLEKLWIDYRKKQGLPVFREDNSLYNVMRKQNRLSEYNDIVGLKG